MSEKNIPAESLSKTATPVNSLHVLVLQGGAIEKLEETLASIANQKYQEQTLRVTVFYKDSGVEALESKYAQTNFIKHSGRKDFFKLFCKTVNESTAAYYVALNSGECFFAHSFDAVSTIFSSYPHISWLTGIQTVKTNKGFNMVWGTTPIRRWNFRIFEQHFYNRAGRHIPPASTFWKKEIWNSSLPNLHFVSEVGFYEALWLCFFKEQPLYTCNHYFSASPAHIFQEPTSFFNGAFTLEKGWINAFREFCFVNNIPYLRQYYKLANRLPPIVRFDYSTQSYFLSNY